MGCSVLCTRFSARAVAVVILIVTSPPPLRSTARLIGRPLGRWEGRRSWSASSTWGRPSGWQCDAWPVSLGSLDYAVSHDGLPQSLWRSRGASFQLTANNAPSNPRTKHKADPEVQFEARCGTAEKISPSIGCLCPERSGGHDSRMGGHHTARSEGPVLELSCRPELHIERQALP